MVSPGHRLEVVSPAKINLSLAILGKQADGFHALHSVVAQTRFGDKIALEWDPESGMNVRRVNRRTKLNRVNRKLKFLQLRYALADVAEINGL